MTLTSFGDAAQMHALGAAGTRMRTDLARLSQELATGLSADPGAATQGNFDLLATNRRALALNESYTEAIRSAVLRASATQTVFDRIDDEIAGLAPRLYELAANGDYHDLVLTNASARGRFEAVVAAMNTRIGGDAVLAGDDPAGMPMLDAEAMLDALRPLVDAAPDAAAAVTVVQDWFLASSGGFETTAWQGGDGNPASVMVAEGHRIDAFITGRDPALRAILSGLALSTLVAEDAGPTGDVADRAMLTAAAEQLQVGESQLIDLRAVLGADEHRLDEARVAAETTRAGLEADYAALVGADPYETATALEETQFRLESLYVVTARLAGLSLTEYLR